MTSLPALLAESFAVKQLAANDSAVPPAHTSRVSSQGGPLTLFQTTKAGGSPRAAARMPPSLRAAPAHRQRAATQP